MSEKIRKIAVVGTGFAGLSLAWQLVKLGHIPDLFEDPQYPAASLIASGLLHLFHGSQARLPPQAQEAMETALEQFTEIGNSEYLELITLLRPALNQMQASIFAKRARQHPQTTEYKPLPWDNSTFALWIHKAYWIDSPRYLKTIRLALEQKGVRFFQKTVVSHEIEKDYDQVVFACGYASTKLSHLTLNENDWTLTRGQLAHLSLEQEPAYVLNAKTYLIPQTRILKPQLSESKNDPIERKWIMGSTFERLPLSSTFDTDVYEIEAREKLCEQTQKLWPGVALSLAQPEKVSWHIGYRLAGPNHLPQITQIDAKTYTFTGLGSKGILYGAFLAKKLAYYIDTRTAFESYQP